jgi:hypothetical protein
LRIIRIMIGAGLLARFGARTTVFGAGDARRQIAVPG